MVKPLAGDASPIPPGITANGPGSGGEGLSNDTPEPIVKEGLTSVVAFVRFVVGSHGPISRDNISRTCKKTRIS